MMIYSEKSKSGLIRRYKIVGGRRLSNYWWAVVIFLGGFGFLVTGVSSYLNKNLWLLPLFLFSFNIVEVLTKSIEKGTEFVGLMNATKIVEMSTKLIGTNFFLFPLILFGFAPESIFLLMGDNGREIKEVSTRLADSVHHANLSTPLISNASLSFSSAAHPLTLEPSSMVESMEKNLSFFPQGLVLCFYGILGLCFSFHLWFTIFWQIGGGFNEFNGEEKSVRIFRWGASR